MAKVAKKAITKGGASSARKRNGREPIEPAALRLAAIRALMSIADRDLSTQTLKLPEPLEPSEIVAPVEEAFARVLMDAGSITSLCAAFGYSYGDALTGVAKLAMGQRVPGMREVA